jgi:diguanylate cyclase
LKRFNSAAVLYGLLVLALLITKVVAPAASFPDWLSDLTVLRMSAVAKILFLGLGALFTHRAATSFEADNAARPAWRLLGVGLAGFTLGQCYLGFYPLVLGQTTPYPSVADIAFMVAYPFVLVAFWRFIRAYRESGLPVGSRREHRALALTAAAVFVAIGYVALEPVSRASAPPLEKALNIAYPAFDFLILIPLVILLRITVRFRGGRIWTIWAALLAGFVSMGAGDILYSYFVTLGHAWLESLIDVLFLISYILVSQATLKQYELLES